MAIGRAYTAITMHAFVELSWVSILGCAFVSGDKNLGLALIVPYMFPGYIFFLCISTILHICNFYTFGV